MGPSSPELPPEDRGEADDDSGSAAPVEPSEEPTESPEPPPPPQPEPEQVPAGEEVGLDRMWEEAYEELIVPEEEEAPRPRKRREGRSRGLIALSVVLVILLLWTLLSPQVMGPVGEKYVGSPTYASWGNYTGTRELWTGTTTWGVSIRCLSNSSGNSSVDLGVLVTKISERTSNWLFRGTGIELRNISAYDENDNFLGAMTNHSDLGYGVLAYLPIEFPSQGSYWVYVKVKFLVSEVMRIGFLPLEAVQVEKVWIDFPIEVSGA